MSDLGYDKAQSDYDNQSSPVYNNPTCKRCGEYEDKLYDGYCIDCYANDKAEDADVTKEFATSNEKLYTLWWQDLTSEEKLSFIKLLFEKEIDSEHRSMYYVNHCYDYFSDFKDYIRGEYNA